MDEAIRPQTDNAPDWFYPEWASTAPGSQTSLVLDTDSALGRYSLEPKAVGLKDLARMHGHLCDGLVISFVEIKAVLERLFPSDVVDRTDLKAVSKNGPCWLDTVAFMTGARGRHQQGYAASVVTRAALEFKCKTGHNVQEMYLDPTVQLPPDNPQ